MRTKKRTPFIAVGASTILTIFAVLCLMIFALLALSTANTNAKLAQKAADNIKAYYQADKRAEELFSQLRRGEAPPEVTFQEGIYSYCCPMTDTTSLKVEIEKTEEGYRILEWKRIYIGDWVPEESLNIWDGSFED